MLSGFGIEPKLFAKAEDLLEETGDMLPDLILADAETFRSFSVIRSMQNLNRKLNVIVISESEAYLEQAMQAFVSGYLVKPVTPEMLQNQLRHLRFPIVCQSHPAKSGNAFRFISR